MKLYRNKIGSGSIFYHTMQNKQKHLSLVNHHIYTHTKCNKMEIENKEFIYNHHDVSTLRSQGLNLHTYEE